MVLAYLGQLVAVLAVLDAELVVTEVRDTRENRPSTRIRFTIDYSVCAKVSIVVELLETMVINDAVRVQRPEGVVSDKEYDMDGIHVSPVNKSVQWSSGQ